MAKDERPDFVSERMTGEREPQRAPGPAPGKVTRTSKLSHRREAAVQRKVAAPATEAATPRARSRWELTMDPWMDAAHRGLTALAERGQDPVQARGSMEVEEPASAHRVAAAGVSGSGSSLPHLDTIQEAFGGTHDVSQVRAHVGGEAAAASEQLRAEAYATGDHIAFGNHPDLHTAAHEAAHVVQQRAGVQLQGGLGVPGDAYERQADAVADRVVQGAQRRRSAGFHGRPFSDAGATADAGAGGRAAAQSAQRQLDDRMDSKPRQGASLRSTAQPRCSAR